MNRILQLVVILSIQLLLVSCSNTEKIGGENMKTEPIQGKEIASAMLNKQFGQIYHQFGQDLQGVVTLKDFKTMGEQFIAGEEAFNLASSSTLNEYDFYIWHNAAKDKGMQAIVNQDGIIDGFQVLHLTSYPETDQLYSEVKYQLPYNDEWYVYWGGHDVFSNYHYEYEHVRYAYDFVKVVDGLTYQGDPLKNESYYAFDQDVVAPAKGVVVAVVDGIVDNIPGEMNETQPEGNMVVIEHEFGEYSMLAHFKQNSIVVKVGDVVEAGQLLGKSGNSGNSSEAHIHYQVNKKMNDGTELVIPITFANGKQWVKGDIAVN